MGWLSDAMLLIAVGVLQMLLAFGVGFYLLRRLREKGRI